MGFFGQLGFLNNWPLEQWAIPQMAYTLENLSLWLIQVKLHWPIISFFLLTFNLPSTLSLPRIHIHTPHIQLLLALCPGYKNNNLTTFKGMISISRNFILSRIFPHTLPLPHPYSPSGKTFCWPRLSQLSRVTISPLSAVHFMSSLLVTGANKLRRSHFGPARRALWVGRHFLQHEECTLRFLLLKLMPPMVFASPVMLLDVQCPLLLSVLFLCMEPNEGGKTWSLLGCFPSKLSCYHLLLFPTPCNETGVELSSPRLIYKRHGVNEADGIIFSCGLSLHPVFKTLKSSGQQLSLTTAGVNM